MPARRPAGGEAIGRAARLARTERGENQEGFAARAGIDRSYYAAIERGEVNVSVQTIVRIAAGLEVSASFLMARAGP